MHFVNTVAHALSARDSFVLEVEICDLGTVLESLCMQERSEGKLNQIITSYTEIFFEVCRNPTP